jgi:hypothetical protein
VKRLSGHGLEATSVKPVAVASDGDGAGAAGDAGAPGSGIVDGAVVGAADDVPLGG